MGNAGYIYIYIYIYISSTVEFRVKSIALLKKYRPQSAYTGSAEGSDIGSVLNQGPFLDGCRTILGIQKRDPNLENYPYTYSHIVVPFWGCLVGSLIYLSIEWVKPRKGPTMDTVGSWYRCKEPWGKEP